MKVVMNSLQLSISFHGQRDAPCRQAASAVACNLFPRATVSTDKCFPAEKPHVSDSMMAGLFERIAPSWAQSKKTMTLSLGEFAGKKCEACAISAQGKMKCVAQKSPAATNARSAALHARSSRTEMENAVAFASVSGTAAVVALRLRSSRLSAYASLYRPPNR